MLKGFALRLRALVRPARVEAEIDEELRLHLESRIDQLTAGGMPAREARRAALAELGTLTSITEQSRDAIGVRWIEDAARDLRYGVRALARSPLSTIIVILTLALGIGANTAIFSFVYGVFFRPPAVEGPKRLAWIVGRGNDRYRSLSYPEFRAYRETGRAFADVAACQDIIVALGRSGTAEPSRLGVLVVSANYFDVLGLRPVIGRGFLPEEETSADSSPVVIGWGLWQRLFNGERTALGQSIILDGHPFTVVGVAPKGFSGLTDDRDLSGDVAWVPVVAAAEGRLFGSYGGNRLLDDDHHFWFQAFGRLAPGVRLELAAREVATVAGRVASGLGKVPRGFSATALPVSGLQHPARRNGLASTISLVMLVPLTLLLIVCATVANLLLSRAAARYRELGMRRALGASSGRLLRQLLTESTLLALAGGAGGLLVSTLISGLVFSAMEASAEVRAAAGAGWPTVAFAALLVLVVGAACGLAPALRAVGGSLVDVLRDGASAGRSRRKARLTRAFVVVQVTGSIVLLVATGLFLRSLASLARVDVGFETGHALTATFDLSLLDYDAPRAAGFHRALLERVRALPGVSSASLTSSLPLVGPDNTVEVLHAEARADQTAPRITAGFATIYPGYFRALGVPLLAGRDFAEPGGGAASEVVVNETLARRLWPEGSVVGRRIAIPSFARRREDVPVLEVIGIVADHRFRHLDEIQQAVVFVAAPEQTRLFGGHASRMTLIMRTAEADSAPLAGLRAILRDLDPNLPLYKVAAVDDLVADEVRPWRTLSTLVGACGMLAVLLMALGLYGVISSAVVERHREIGVRLALGAERLSVLAMVVRDALRLTVIGMAIGIPLAAGLGRVLAGVLYRVEASDPIVLVAVACLVMAVSLVAGWAPARRAASVDPMVTLRAE